MTGIVASRLVLPALLIFLCVVFRGLLESDPVTHVIVQLPILAFAGWLVAGALPIRLNLVNCLDRNGLTGVLVLIFTVGFWMLPRSIDGALDDPFIEAAKFVSIPVLVGIPAALSWPRLHPLVRGFLKANAISMMGIFAFLYTHAPIRICNSYLVADQERLGFAFLFVAFGLAVLWTVPVFVDKRPQTQGEIQNLRSAGV